MAWQPFGELAQRPENACSEVSEWRLETGGTKESAGLEEWGWNGVWRPLRSCLTCQNGHVCKNRFVSLFACHSLERAHKQQ